MFGIGLPELAVLAFIGVIIFGPDKLPELARQAAQLVRRGKKLADGARDQLRSELGPEYADFEIADLDPRAMVRRHITAAFESEDNESTDYDDDSTDADPDEETEEPGGFDWLSTSTPTSTPATSLIRRSRRRGPTARPTTRTRRTHLTRK